MNCQVLIMFAAYMNLIRVNQAYLSGPYTNYVKQVGGKVLVCANLKRTPKITAYPGGDQLIPHIFNEWNRQISFSK